jgi:hypothetical protein
VAGAERTSARRSEVAEAGTTDFLAVSLGVEDDPEAGERTRALLAERARRG